MIRYILGTAISLALIQNSAVASAATGTLQPPDSCPQPCFSGVSVKEYPLWLDQAAIYHIYPSSFKDSDNDGYGDLEGIRQSLDYIAESGFNTIWLSPVFCSAWQDGGYDITDYYKIDPRFGTNADLDRLVSAAHAKNIKVCLDLVAGHTSDKHPWFKSSAAGEARYKDYYIWTDGKAEKPAAQGKGGWVDNNYARDGYYLMNYYDCQPALNFGYYKPNPEHSWEQAYDAPGPTAVREELRRVIAFWFDRGVDGFRCDMAWSLVKGDDAEFHGVRRLWKEIFDWSRANYPDRIFLSEWSSPIEAVSCGFDIDIIRHNGCGKTMYRDLVYNTQRNIDSKTGEYPARDCWFDKAGRGSIKSFVEPFRKMYSATRNQGYPCMPTSSHDTWRLNRNQRSTTEELKVAMAFFLTMPWVPIVYYGEEIGMRSMDGVKAVEGSRDRSAERTPMQWNWEKNAGFSACPPEKLYLPVDPSEDRPDVASQLADPSSLLNFTRALLKLRREIPALSNGTDWEFLTDTDKAYPAIYRRSCGDESYLVVLNPSEKEVSAMLDIPYEAQYVFGTDENCCTFKIGAAGTQVTIRGISCAILKVKFFY